MVDHSLSMRDSGEEHTKSSKKIPIEVVEEGHFSFYFIVTRDQLCTHLFLLFNSIVDMIMMQNIQMCILVNTLADSGTIA